MLNPGEILIHSGNAHQFAAPPTGQGFGLVPRNYAAHPHGCFMTAPKATFTKIPRSEWSGRIKELADKKALLSDLRNIGMGGKPIPSRDQNGKGYCWAHSTTSAAILSRCKNNEPYADLSAYAIACIIKNYADEGGWNGESMKFLSERGCPTSEFWPQQSMSSSNDKPSTWENAALHKDTEWADIAEGDFDMQMTCLLMGFPHALDLNWWSHSICAVDPVDGASTFGILRTESGKLMGLIEFNMVWEVDAGGGFGIRIWNSWGDSWSDNGMGILTESKATNNGAMAMIAVRGSVV